MGERKETEKGQTAKGKRDIERQKERDRETEIERDIEREETRGTKQESTKLETHYSCSAHAVRRTTDQSDTGVS